MSGAAPGASVRGSGPSDAAADRRRALLLGALTVALYLSCAPAVVNLDGLGYLKLLPHNFAAGHLLFMPLLRAATALCGGDGLAAGRLLDALLGGTAVVLTYGIARRLAADALPSSDEARFAASIAAVGFALSFGPWTAGADVEAYAAAEVALLCTVRLTLAHRDHPTLSRALLTGLCLGVAVLCHLTNVLLAILVLEALRHAPLHRPTGLRHAGLALTVGAALSIGMYGYAALIVRGHDLPAAARWIATAAHGFRDAGGPYRFADALYGLCRSIVYAPSLWEADARKLIGQFVLGLLPLFALGTALYLRRSSLPRLPWTLLVAWSVPYALLAVLFFGSDPERWLFVLPVLWLLGAVLIAPQRRAAISLCVALGVTNLLSGALPAHRDTTVQKKAEAVGPRLADGDLLIFPGHGWDEYVTFFAHAKVEPFPVSYYAARDGVEAGFARLDREIAAARARGGQVYALRIFDDADEDPRGFYELSTLGVSRSVLRARLSQNLRPAPVDGSLVKLSPTEDP